jgi:hypothetical protein
METFRLVELRTNKRLVKTIDFGTSPSGKVTLVGERDGEPVTCETEFATRGDVEEALTVEIDALLQAENSERLNRARLPVIKAVAFEGGKVNVRQVSLPAAASPSLLQRAQMNGKSPRTVWGSCWRQWVNCLCLKRPCSNWIPFRMSQAQR